MKKLFSSLLLVVAVCAAASTAPRVSRTALAAMERSLDERIKGLWEDNLFALLGATRGIYLDGYGAVFTAEVNPVTSMTMMMHPTVTKEDVIKAHRSRLDRVAQLKVAMRQALADSAASLDPVPDSEQIIMVVFLAHHPWEDTSGTPGQLTFQGKKRALLDARRAGGAALAQAVQVIEY